MANQQALDRQRVGDRVRERAATRVSEAVTAHHRNTLANQMALRQANAAIMIGEQTVQAQATGS